MFSLVHFVVVVVVLAEKVRQFLMKKKTHYKQKGLD